MRKWLLASMGFVALGVAVAGGFLLASLLTAGPVQAAEAKKGEEGPKAASLPLRQVVLFSSGVGYFQRQGKVSGDALRLDASRATSLVRPTPSIHRCPARGQ
jgi:hypothetical protein